MLLQNSGEIIYSSPSIRKKVTLIEVVGVFLVYVPQRKNLKISPQNLGK